MAMIKIREACEDDRESAVRVLWKAFEATNTFEDVMKQDWIKRWNSPERKNFAYVAVEDKKVVANLSFFITDEHEQIIRRKPVRFAGVWAVATDPAYRRKGLVRKLFDASFPRMREEGVNLTILDPFYRPFYEKFGYAIAERRMRHVLKRDYLRVGKMRSDVGVREATADDIPALGEIERSMTRFGSRFFQNKEAWEYLMKDGHLHVLEDDSGPVATAWFSFARGERGYDVTAGVSRYKSDDVFPSIVELVRNYSANASKLTWWTDENVPVRHFLSEIHPAESYLIGSMMMRALDIEGFCKEITIPEESSDPVTIEVKDAQCGWNNGVFRLLPSGGKLDVQASQGEPDVSLNAFQLSQVIAGVTPPALLRALGEIQCSRDTARRLEAIFEPDNFVSYIRF
jgi:predicted acetyltransferase